MSVKIDNERQLHTAQDFVEFIKEHNRRALAEKSRNSEDMYDIAVRMASLINCMAKELAVKQTEISEFRTKIDELEREIRVSKDLLRIARAVDDAK